MNYDSAINFCTDYKGYLAVIDDESFKTQLVNYNRELEGKASKNKCIVSHLRLHLIHMAGKRRLSAFSQFLTQLSRHIRSGLKLHLKLY